MKVELLKSIIKEAIREVLQEELSGLINPNKTWKVEEISTPQESKPTTDKPATLDEMIAMTRASMTDSEYKDIINANSGMVTRGGPQTPLKSMIETYTGGNEPGIDLNTLPFLQKASTLLNLADTKTKQRHNQ